MAEIAVALTTLTVLEIVLGVDNIIFISILSGSWKDRSARRLGLIAAMGMRIALLLGISWIVSLTQPLLGVLGREFSGRDLILIGGGLFLLAKATYEIHDKLEGAEGTAKDGSPASFASVIFQVMLLDIVFSLDSVITAVGMADDVSHDRRRGPGGARHDGGRRADQPLRRGAPTIKILALCSAADRVVAGRRQLRHIEKGLHLLRHGLLGVRRDDQHPDRKKGPPMVLRHPYWKKRPEGSKAQGSNA